MSNAIGESIYLKPYFGILEGWDLEREINAGLGLGIEIKYALKIQLSKQWQTLEKVFSQVRYHPFCLSKYNQFQKNQSILVTSSQ